MTTQEINQAIVDGVKAGTVDTNLLSDQYHSFSELYEHRIQLWIAYCKLAERILHDNIWGHDNVVWRSKYHSDGELAFGGGWFVLGLGENAGKQLTYHLPETYWDQCDFATTLPKAPDFDGHTSAEVLERIKRL